jgi:hypothetical protein
VLDISITVITIIFRSYLADQSMDHLSSTLKKGGIKDLLLFFPDNTRSPKRLDEHFRKENLIVVADWWAKKQYAAQKEAIIRDLKELLERDESVEHVRARFFYSDLFFGGGRRS